MISLICRLLLVILAVTLPLSWADEENFGLEDAPTITPTTSSAPTISNAPSISSYPTWKPVEGLMGAEGIGRDFCNVCANWGQFDADRVYPNWGLKCRNLGDATLFGLDCQADIQTRFGAFCGCPGAVAGCGICAQGESLPSPDRVIPLLWESTCHEVNVYTSLRLAEECQDHLDSYPFDTSAYCGCNGTAKTNTCSFCPVNETIIDPNFVPAGSYGSTCEELKTLLHMLGMIPIAAMCKVFPGLAAIQNDEWW